MITLVLHGCFAPLLPGGRIAVRARTVLEAIRIVFTQLAEEHPAARRRARALGWTDTARLVEPVEDDLEVHVVPEFLGGKDGGAFIQIGLGTVLTAAGVALTVASGGAGSPLGVALMGMGVSMMLGGVIGLLMPAPETPKSKGDKSSNYLGTPGNTVASGTRIPIMYGRCQAYGHYLSFNIQAKDIGF